MHTFNQLPVIYLSLIRLPLSGFVSGVLPTQISSA